MEYVLTTFVIKQCEEEEREGGIGHGTGGERVDGWVFVWRDK